MAFCWMPAAGLRHATAHERPQAGDAITTLCGCYLIAEGWRHHHPRYPTCLDCEEVWREIEALPQPELALAETRARANEAGNQ